MLPLRITQFILGVLVLGLEAYGTTIGTFIVEVPN